MLEKIIKARKIVIGIYLIILIVVFFVGLAYEALIPALTEMVKWNCCILGLIVIIFGILEDIKKGGSL